MRVFAIFALIQISGIFGDPITPELNQTQIEELEKIGMLQSFVSAIGSKPFEELPSNITSACRAKCTVHGGPDADIAALESIEVYTNALRALENETQFQLALDAGAVDGGLDSAIEAFCHWAMTFESLSRTFIDSFKRCWSPDERNTVDLMRNILSAIAGYICENKGSHVSAFLAADGADCSGLTETKLKNCSRTSLSGHTTPSTHSDTVFYPPWSIPAVTLTTQVCRGFETFQNCTVGALEECQNPTASYEMNSLLNAIKKSSGCEELLKPQNS